MTLLVLVATTFAARGTYLCIKFEGGSAAASADEKDSSTAAYLHVSGLRYHAPAHQTFTVYDMSAIILQSSIMQQSCFAWAADGNDANDGKPFSHSSLLDTAC